MPSDTCAAALLACAESQIRFIARQLVRKPGFCWSELEDIEQTLRLGLLEKAHLYDPSRGAMSTFIKAVLNSAAAMLRRDRRRLKRGAGHTVISLQSEIRDEEREPTTLADIATSDDQNRRTGNSDVDPINRRETSEAVNQTIESLAPEQAKISESLKKTGTVAGAAKDRGVSRRQTTSALPELRKRFQDARLKKF